MTTPRKERPVQHAYAAIAATLREEVLANTWPPGTALPTLNELQERFNVSRITVRGAIEQLAAEGLVYTGYIAGRRGTIVRSRGRVTHYATDAVRADRPAHTTDSFEESAARAGRTPSKRFVMSIAQPPPMIAQRLGVEPDALVVQRAVYQLLDSEPWSREVSYFPRDIAEQTGIDTPHDLPQGTLRRLREAGYAEIAWVDEVTDETAGPDDAADLAVTVGSRLLVQTRTGATAERITRVTRTVRMGGRTCLAWELGADVGLALIRRLQVPGGQP
jgi:GntR family transcriptional regulator